MFDFGQLLNSLGHNFMQNMRDGSAMGTPSPDGQPPSAQQRMLSAASVLTGQGGQPNGMGAGGQGGQQNPLMAALMRFGQGQHPGAAPGPSPGTLPAISLPPGQGQQPPMPAQLPPMGGMQPQPPQAPAGGLPLPDPALSGAPGFADIFKRFGGGSY